LLSTALVSSIGSTQVQLRSVTVADDVAYFGFGNSDAIGRLTWNSSLHQSAKNTTAGSSIADILQTFHGSTAGTQVWRAVSSAGAVSYATAQDLSTEVTFGGSIPVGDASYRFTNLLPYDGVMYAFKEDSVWSIRKILYGLFPRPVPVVGRPPSWNSEPRRSRVPTQGALFSHRIYISISP
jgi:hypothetical protein